ncbi:MAG: ribonuclease R [Flavobacteriales bacterium]
MSKNKKNKSDGALTNMVLDLFYKAGKELNHKQICKDLRVTTKDGQRQILNILFDLIDKGSVKEIHRGKFVLGEGKGSKEGLVGRADFTASGAAYVIVEGSEEDIYVPAKFTGDALHQDMVKVELIPGRGKKPEGKIVEVVERKRTDFIGTVELVKDFGFVVPDNPKIHVDFYVPSGKLNKAKNGEKVIVKMLDWPKNAKNPNASILEVLGKAGDNDVEMHAILFQYGLPSKFPKEVEEYAERIPDKISEAEIAKRRDMRKITTFTIDPHDAKDFDDALSIQKLPNGNWEIGVHIADVSHYVLPGSIIDKEAYDRATSVYLVDRVVPMLPEKLSNGVCSLRPHEEKLCFSCIFEINDKAEVLDRWIGRTVIYSDRRFTYEEAQQVIETGEGDLKEEILTFDRLAKILRKERMKDGAISFDKLEVKFHLDPDGTPTGIYFKESKDANKLIEEFMLLANKYVALYAGKDQKKTFVYRVHDLPGMEKFNVFAGFVKQFGYNLHAQTPRQVGAAINKMLIDAKTKNYGSMLETLAVRTMAKAEYSTENIGHYGLAFDFYSHFTSPIRRYPDVIAHRLLQQYLDGGSSANKNVYEEQCVHCSEREKLAADAERDSTKYKQVEYLKAHLGETFEAVISGVTEWGLYCEIIENRCEGMVSLKTMFGDSWAFDPDNYRIVGRNTGKIYQFGDKVKIKVMGANLVKKQLDFTLVDEKDEDF